MMRWTTREPCASCPYRRDAELGHWHAEEFLGLLKNDADPTHGAIYGCHGTRKLPEGPAICAGWLLDQKRRNVPSIPLRLALLCDENAAEAIEHVHDGGHELFDSIEEMCRANLPARKVSGAEERLIAAAIRAARARPERVFSLMELEAHGGPACGSAGSIVKRWPSGGLLVEGARLLVTKRGRATAIRVELIGSSS